MPGEAHAERRFLRHYREALRETDTLGVLQKFT
jgi:hypothetical protein